MKICKFVSWTKDENEMVLINSEAYKCLVLDGIGTEIWLDFTETFR